MTSLDPQKAREFAIDVVRKLRAAGYEALWAGGCVRDQLLGCEPKDYDVATNAAPEDIRQVFGRRRTLAIGAAFGVISVLGPRRAGQIEVATFRKDAPYSDGRHPDSVTFSSADEDARRRDFTINGLFYDPLEKRVIDFVGGQRDLEQKVVRAIGDPGARFGEDKLRMLRAVRFAATLDFHLEDSTRDAIRQQAHELTIVSAERVAAELRAMLCHANRKAAVRLLRDVNLLEVILPESKTITDDSRIEAVSAWDRTLDILGRLNEPTFPLALAGLVWEIHRQAPQRKTAARICRRWKLTNEETDTLWWLLSNEEDVRQARRLAWPRLQRILISNGIEQLLELAEAVANVVDGSLDEVNYCRSRLALPADVLNPPPLIDGNDLIAAGIPTGPAYKTLLEQTRDAQLEGRIDSKAAALQFAQDRWAAMQ